MSLAKSLQPAMKVGRDSVRLGESPRLGDMLAPLGTRAVALAAVLVALPFVWPLSLGPFTLGASAVLFYLGISLARGSDRLNLPQKCLDCRIPGKVFRVTRWVVAQLAKFRHGDHPSAHRHPLPQERIAVAGWGILVGAALLAVPIPFLPLTNTFPALGVICCAQYLLRGHRYLLLLATASYAAGALLLVGLGWLALRATGV